MTPRYSLVIPLYNEAGNVAPVVGSAVRVLQSLGTAFEVVLIDDGSTDATAAEIKQLGAGGENFTIQVQRHPDNRGQAAALLTGLQAARGEIIATMDGDGQNDPSDLPALIAAVESGALDVACGWRVERHDSWLRRAMSRIANRVRRTLLRDGLHDAGCQLRALRRDVVPVLFPVDLLQTFLPAIAAAAGFRVGEFPVRHHPRVRGDAKFGLKQLWWRPAVAMLHVRRRLQPLRRAAQLRRSGP